MTTATTTQRSSPGHSNDDATVMSSGKNEPISYVDSPSEGVKGFPTPHEREREWKK